MLLSTACAAPYPQEHKTQQQLLAEQGYVRGEAIRSIPNYRISGWEYLDPQNIILNGGARQKYLVVFTSRCQDLRWSETLATTSTLSQLTVFDTVLTRRFDSPGLSRCPIQELYLLESIE